MSQAIQQFYEDLPPSPLSELHSPLLTEKQIQLYLKRDDLLHPVLGGNKLRTLKYNLIEAQKQHKNTLVTFGGAYSNHIAAVAAAGAKFGFNTAGFIRGEETLPLNPTLAAATAQGMQLHYLSREDYRQKNQPGFLKSLLAQYNYQNAYVLPEGGSNALALRGCAEMINELPKGWQYVCTPVGTGASMAGLIAGSGGEGKIIGFPALKGASFLSTDIENLLSAEGCGFTNWSVELGYHFGGYAKFKPELLSFINSFYAQHQIQLEPIYTGKMMYGVYDLIQQDYFPRGVTIIAWHTGGLQGLAGLALH